ncbi:MAG: hypothetical protein ROZ09_13245 [Thiobacillus sp.]|jgi:hypothetical protein|uniref:hypothetical protein n=1 Tax=Thiobacillus sp. TaxID=924 RepID=UPI002893C4E3|nr:hypothetical protein [Thiobacillus sp.]MDT3707782.1 hypothetical protein [Thiobacillus sp.]
MTAKKLSEAALHKDDELEHFYFHEWGIAAKPVTRSSLPTSSPAFSGARPIGQTLLHVSVNLCAAAADQAQRNVDQGQAGFEE